MRSSMVIVSCLVLAVAACGGKSKGAVASGGGGGGLATRLPWEAALTKGASFELTEDTGGEDADTGTLKVTVTDVVEEGGVRVYRLAWTEGDDQAANGPQEIRIENGAVLVGDAEAKQMKEPFTNPAGVTCYGEDFSNPDGCDDVCDADLCFDDTGLQEVSGLYAPDYSIYSRK